MALSVPILAMLAFGGIEFGVLIGHDSDLGDATRAAARMGTATTTTATGDYDILRSISSDRSLLEEGSIERVVIFRSPAGVGGHVPTECLTQSYAYCNSYDGSALTKSSAHIDQMQSDGWDPSERLATGSGDQPFLGVHIVAKHETLTGFFPSIKDTVSETVVMKVEPGQDTEGTVGRSAARNNWMPCQVDCGGGGGSPVVVPPNSAPPVGSNG